MSRGPASESPAVLERGRRARKKAEVHARLRESALRLMVEHGYEAVTVEQITGAADVAKGTFFNYYPSKGHVLVEYWRSLADEIFGYAGTVAPTPSRRAIQAIYAFMARRAVDQGRVFRLLVQQVFVQPQLRALEEEEGPEFGELLVEVLSAGIRCGELRQTLDAELAVRAIGDLWTGAVVEWAFAGGGTDLRSEVRARLDLLFDGLASPVERAAER